MCHGLVTVATESTHNLHYVVILSVSTHPNSWKLCLGTAETNSIRQLPADTHTKFSHKLMTCMHSQFILLALRKGSRHLDVSLSSEAGESVDP